MESTLAETYWHSTERMTIPEMKELLWETANKYSDKELEEVLMKLQKWAYIIVNFAEKNHKNNS